MINLILKINYYISIILVNISILFIIYFVINYILSFNKKNNKIFKKENNINKYIYIYIYIIFIFIVKSFIYEIYYISSNSMFPSINIHDLLLTKKNTIFNKININRNDLIVFKFPLNKNINYIKRVIGMPNETIIYNFNNKKISFLNNKVNVKYINIKKITDYIKNKKILNINNIKNYNNIYIVKEKINNNINNILIDNNIKNNNIIKYKIPKNYYFVLGDNRDNSFDSRNLGFIEKKFITGKVILKILNIKLEYIKIIEKINKINKFTWIFLKKYIY